MLNDITIRPAKPEEAPLILAFISDLAEYEKLSHDVHATLDDVQEAIFGEKPHAECLVAFDGDDAVGFAIYFHNFSTFLSRHGIYLEDLFVKPEARGRGIGKSLLQKLAAIAVERNCGRLEWAVLDWNQPAIGFYESLGAKILDDWRLCRLEGDMLKKLADSG